MAAPMSSMSRFLTPFISYGIKNVTNTDRPQAIADCPFCSASSKMYINTASGLWDCKSCRTSGNIYSFMQKLWDTSDKSTNAYSDLRESRSLLHDDTLMAWGLVRSKISKEWLAPAYNTAGTITQLYRYLAVDASGKKRLLLAKDTSHGLHGVPLYDHKKHRVYVVEGLWNTMVFWETARMARWSSDGGKLELTGASETSILSGSNVLGIPGANVFFQSWATLLAGKDVYIITDNDHPKKHASTGQIIEGAGFLGAKRMAEIMAMSEAPPKSIHYLQWGRGKQYFDEKLKSGYDIRDMLSSQKTIKDRIPVLEKILDKFQPIPEEWIDGRSKASRANGEVQIELIPCTSWEDLVTAWKKGLLFTEGLDRGLSCMLAVIISTLFDGDQLWMRILGPASCGKSTLCEGISTNKAHVVPKSVIRGFHSGFRGSEGEDNSLISILDGKTLVTKDGDTLMTSPNLPQILSEARDVYDRQSRTHYRHGMNNEYEELSITWLLCGTSAIKALDTSELGERFLDCRVVDRIDEEIEDSILDRVTYRAFEMVPTKKGKSAKEDKEATHTSAALSIAMRMTGGYIDYLKANQNEIVSKITISDESLATCASLGKFVAYLRARPSKRQGEMAEREFASRLVGQIVRLAKSLAAVMNKAYVDSEVLRRVKRVAIDTAQGMTLEFSHVMARAHTSGGVSYAQLAATTGISEDKVATLMAFMKKIKAVQAVPQKTKGIGVRARYILTDQLYSIYRKVYDAQKQSLPKPAFTQSADTPSEGSSEANIDESRTGGDFEESPVEYDAPDFDSEAPDIE